jgi:ribonuclease D
VTAVPAFVLVDDDAGLQAVVEELAGAPAYAVDTEFHRERTYFPTLALVQIASAERTVLIDPRAVDPGPLCEVLNGPGLAVMHAATQDLEVLYHACGAVPSRLFDTQLAAGFVGMSSPSLVALVDRELGIRLPKGDRLTDWLRRPLTAEQLGYAAADVDHLLELHRRLGDELAALGRLEWADAECEQLRLSRPWERDPEAAWRRIKEARQLRGTALGVAQAVAAWRERRAASIDQPVRFVLPDLSIVGIAQRPPRRAGDLRRIRGLDERHLRNGAAEEILAVVKEGLSQPPPSPPPGVNGELARELRPAVTLVSAWMSQLSRDLRLDTSLLATRADLEALLRGDPHARLAEGWRAEVVGEPIRQLVEGRAALAFDGHGGLVLEERSNEPIPPNAPMPTD